MRNDVFVYLMSDELHYSSLAYPEWGESRVCGGWALDTAGGF